MQMQDNPLIFVVDGNSLYNRLIASHLRLNKFQRIECFLSGEECLENIDKKPDIVIQDYLMNGINGIEVLKASKKRNPKTEFIFMSGECSFDIAVNTIKSGAYDYVVKDQFAFKKLISSINEITKIQQIKPRKNFFKMVFPFL